MSNIDNFKNNLRILIENSYRNGFANNIPNLPVIEPGYSEDTPDQTNDVVDPKKDLSDLLNDIMVAGQSVPEIKDLVVKAKQLVGCEDLEIQPIKEDVSQEPLDPVEPIVTSGETTPWECPRSDEYVGRDDVSTEIASLLVTIGHILQSARLIPNKFDVPMVMKYINQTFASQTPEQFGALCESLELDEGKFGKGLAALGLAATSLVGGHNVQASDQSLPRTTSIGTETSTPKTLDIKKNISIRTNAHKVANYILKDATDKSKINDISNKLVTVASSVYTGELSQDRAFDIISKQLNVDESGKRILKIFLQSVEKMD